jgi:hypothetical protein
MRTALTIEVTTRYFLSGTLIATRSGNAFEVVVTNPTPRQALALAHLMLTYSGFQSESGKRMQEEAEVMLADSDIPF